MALVALLYTKKSELFYFSVYLMMILYQFIVIGLRISIGIDTIIR